MSPDSAEEKLALVMGADITIIATMAKAIYEQYGDEGLDVVRNGLQATLPQTVRSLARRVGARTRDGDITDWARVERYTCEFFDLEAQLDVEPTRGVIRVLSCPMAKHYARIFPQCCRLVLIGLERGIASAINPNLKVYGDKYLSEGDEYCQIRCELE